MDPRMRYQLNENRIADPGILPVYAVALDISL